MTDDDIRAHVMKAEGVLDQIQDKVTSQFGDARKAIMAIDRAYSQLLSSRDFYREARNELITDRDHWEHEAKEAQRNFRSMQSQSNQLRDEVLEQSQIIGDLKAENAELRAGQGHWPDDKPDDFPCCSGERTKLQDEVDQLSHALRLASREKDEWEANYTELADSTPRVISADELSHDMWVTGKREDGTWTAGTVNGNSSIISRGGLWLGALEDFGHFILLEDAPTSDDDGDDFPCCDRDTVPRLIAADELESGAKVATFTDQSRPVAGTVTGEATGKVTLLLHNDNLMGFATEHTFVLLEDGPEPEAEPEPEPVTVETIRASEPGTVWRDRNGAKHEWTGERLAWHTRAGGLGKGDFLTNGGFETDGPWSRSTAAPRGDYDTPPRLTVHALNVAPVGSVVHNGGGLGWTKTERGKWTGALGLQKWSSTELLAYADSDATLTHPGQS